MELALGTVQFGLAYGVAGRGAPVPSGEVRAILARARALGVRWLDTAPAYGDIEERLTDLIGDHHEFSVVSKIPAAPAQLAPGAAAHWVTDTLNRSRDRLGHALTAILFHRAEDLLDPQGIERWQAASAFASAHGLDLGVSCYGPGSLTEVTTRFPVTLAQLPGNALDQRLCHTPPADMSQMAIHVRSAFLQGLLLMPESDACARVPAAAAVLERWHAWCRDHESPPLEAALGLVKALPGATHCVVGVDSLAQLEAIVAAWNEAPAIVAPELACDDVAVIDPRNWPSAD
jgi:aryl-alcohol dehydrogenase-like predicted oxidoreductase